MTLDRICTIGTLVSILGMLYAAALVDVEQRVLDKQAGPQPVPLWVSVPVCPDQGDFVCVLDRAHRLEFNRKHGVKYARR